MTDTGCRSAVLDGQDFHVLLQVKMDTLSWLHWKIHRVAFYHCELGEPKPFVIMFVYQAGILGHVEELQLLAKLVVVRFL